MHIQITKKTFTNIFAAIAKALRAHGDAMFVVCVAFIIAGAAWLFYELLYPPIFAPQTPRAFEAPFNTEVYKQILDHSTSRADDLQKQLESLPPNPF